MKLGFLNKLSLLCPNCSEMFFRQCCRCLCANCKNLLSGRSVPMLSQVFRGDCFASSVVNFVKIVQICFLNKLPLFCPTCSEDACRYIRAICKKLLPGRSVTILCQLFRGGCFTSCVANLVEIMKFWFINKLSSFCDNCSEMFFRKSCRYIRANCKNLLPGRSVPNLSQLFPGDCFTSFVDNFVEIMKIGFLNELSLFCPNCSEMFFFKFCQYVRANCKDLLPGRSVTILCRLFRGDCFTSSVVNFVKIVQIGFLNELSLFCPNCSEMFFRKCCRYIRAIFKDLLPGGSVPIMSQLFRSDCFTSFVADFVGNHENLFSKRTVPILCQLFWDDFP